MAPSSRPIWGQNQRRERERRWHEKERLARREFRSLPQDELDQILDPREQKVLRLKWGIEDGREYNNREIGLELCVGDERVRQIQNYAISKIAKAIKLREGCRR